MKVRKQEHVDEVSSKILDCAYDIILKEGLDKLSMRKIAAAMDYTPGILYHYYKDKDTILCEVAKRGYMSIVEVLMQSSIKDMPIEEKVAYTLKQYMKSVLKNPELFQIMVMSDIPMLRLHINMLQKNIRTTRKSIDILCSQIEQGIQEGVFHPAEVEVRAQVIWSATYGVLSRMIMEKPESDVIEAMIEEHCDMVLKGLK